MMEPAIDDARLRVSFNFRETELSIIHNGVSVWQVKHHPGAVDWIFDILQFMRVERDLLIGRHSAEKVLLVVGAATPLQLPLVTEVKGRNLKTGYPSKIEVTSEEIRKVIHDAQALTWNVADSLTYEPREGILHYPSHVPLEYRPSIRQQPIELTGEFRRIKGLDQRIAEATGLKVILLNE